MACSAWRALAALSVFGFIAAGSRDNNVITAKDAMEKPHFQFQVVPQEALAAPGSSQQVAVDEGLAPGNLNALVDSALAFLRKWIVREGLDVSPLPDIDESISHGYFKANQGYFQHLSTIQRASDVLVTGPPTNATIVGDFGLADLNFYFGHYRVRYYIISVKGTVQGWIKLNRVRVGVRLVTGPPGVCSVALETFQVVQLDGITVKLTGLARKLSKFATRALNRAKGKLAAAAEQRAAQRLRQAFAELDCAQVAARVAPYASGRPAPAD